MIRRIALYIIVIISISIQGCYFSSDKANNDVKQTDHNKEIPLVEEVLSAEGQAALTPNMVINNLKEGNQRFINNELIARNYPKQVQNSTHGQHPEAIILTCIDSRVPVEYVFDKGVGDVFVARVAGNFVNTDILGSMEYACKVAGSKVIMVLGHEHCGAVKAAINNVELGNITEMLSNIEPAIESLSDFEGDKSSANKKYVHAVCEQNVVNSINEIRERSPILYEMEKNGDIKIVGAIYNMSTGMVSII